MSSYEDIQGLASSVLETFKTYIQWQDPQQWEIQSIQPIQPIQSIQSIVTEQIALKFGQPQYLPANPTLAAPTNLRLWIQNLVRFEHEPSQLAVLVAFLFAVPLFSTFLVGWGSQFFKLPKSSLSSKTNMWKGFSFIASPLAVLFVMVTMFGNFPLAYSFPASVNSGQVQSYTLVQPGHYTGAIARVVHIAALYEVVETVTCLLFQMGQYVYLCLYDPSQKAIQSHSSLSLSWLSRLIGLALRIWITRMSTDYATEPIQSGSTVWVWGGAALRTRVSFQTEGELMDDVFIWTAYFAVTYSISSMLARRFLSTATGM